jgi:spermidine synthase
MASIDRALRASLPQVLWLPGTTSLVLASRSIVPSDPDTFAARLARRRLVTRLVTPAYLRYLLTNDRGPEIAHALAAARAPVNRDARPVRYSYTLLLWLARFYPRLAYAGPPPVRAPAVAAVAALLVLALATRRRRAMLVAAAGFAGMLAESVLLLAYQARQGVLYQDLGLLLMAFMAGLAIGAAAWGGEARRRPPAAVLLVALMALGAALAATLEAQVPFALATTALWLAAAGALTAALFAHASRRLRHPGAAAGRLYGADLLGGCLGSLAASLILIPLLGLAGAALAISAVAALALLWV